MGDNLSAKEQEGLVNKILTELRRSTDRPLRDKRMQEKLSKKS